MKEQFRQIHELKEKKEKEMGDFLDKKGIHNAQVWMEFGEISKSITYYVSGFYGHEEIPIETLKEFAEKYNLDITGIRKNYTPSWNGDNLQERIVDMHLSKCLYIFTDEYQGWYGRK
jgi:hypothetical protein